MDEEACLLLDLVSVPSPTGDTEAITQLLLDRAHTMGLRARVDGAGNVHMVAGEGEPRILFLCHMDTVPGDLPVLVEGGVLYGRGSVDAKGCLAAAMSATARLVHRAGPGTVEVVAVPDEEGLSEGTRHLVRGPAPAAVLVGEPSGWQGVTLGYKGALRLRFLFDTPKAHAGAGGRNSAEMAVSFWNALEARLAEESEASGVSGLFGVPSATLEAVNTTDDGLSHATDMRIDLRIPPGFDTDALLSFLGDVRDGASMEVVSSEPPVLAPKNNPLVRAMLAAIRAEGGEPVFKRKTGTSDMNLAAAEWPGVPIVAYGPGDSGLDHTPEERLDLDEYARVVRVMHGVVATLLETLSGRSNL